jgi:hypothetical protein
MAQVTDELRIDSNQSPYVTADDDGTTPNCIRIEREKIRMYVEMAPSVAGFFVGV